MTHISLLLVCIVSVEILIQSKYLFFLRLIVNLTKKIIYIFFNAKISDHWKEKVIPVYALRIMKCSISMFLIILLILFLIFFMSYLINDLLDFSLSIIGALEAVIFTFGYARLRKSFV
jgi:hypothetical protein